MNDNSSKYNMDGSPDFTRFWGKKFTVISAILIAIVFILALILGPPEDQKFEPRFMNPEPLEQNTLNQQEKMESGNDTI